MNLKWRQIAKETQEGCKYTVKDMIEEFNKVIESLK
jgi:hypothetical protein